MHLSSIITIGDELLIGQTIDTNSVWIAQELNKIGFHIHERVAVADQKEQIIETLDRVLSKVQVVIITGGLGPTEDDLTKPTLASYFQSRLVQNEEVLQHIKDIFTKRNRPFQFRNLKQAEVPHNCTVLFNQYGTAPGMWFEKDGKIIVSLPGVPFEMEKIMKDSVLPKLKELFQNQFIYHKNLLIMNMGESILANKISDIEANLPQSVSMAYLPGMGFVKLRFSGQGLDEAKVKKIVDYEAQKVIQRFPNHCAAEKDIAIEEAVAELFIEKKLSLGFAESCTGGYFSHKITNIPGCSAFFKGSIISYSNEIKEKNLLVSAETIHEKGAVSKEIVEQMAINARKILNVDIALAVSGILGPTGGTDQKPVGLIHLAISSKEKVVHKQFHFIYDRIRNKEMILNHGLECLRLFVKNELA